MWWKIEGKTEKGTGKVSAEKRKKLIVTFLTITILLVALIGRIMYIEVTSGENMKKSF